MQPCRMSSKSSSWSGTIKLSQRRAISKLCFVSSRFRTGIQFKDSNQSVSQCVYKKLLSVKSWRDIDGPNLAELLDPIRSTAVFEDTEVLLAFVAHASFGTKCRVKLLLCFCNNYKRSSCVQFFLITGADW